MFNTFKTIASLVFLVVITTALGHSQSTLVNLSFAQLKSGQFQGILHCTGPMWTPEEHAGYLEAFPDTRSMMVRHGINLAPTQRFSFAQLVSNVAANMDRFSSELPLLSISFNTIKNKTRVGLDADVAAGRFDPKIAQLAQLVQSRRVPVFIRIGPEANGYWNGYAPQSFQQAFRHIVAIFQAQRVDNAIFMWNYKAVLDQNVVAPYLDFYPGDDVVDWWSVDLFKNDFLNATIRQKVKTFLADAAARGKPVIIPESAPSTLDIGAPMGKSHQQQGSRGRSSSSQTTWNTWFVPYFDLINTEPNVKAFCYSNRNFFKNDVKLKDWGNLRIDQSPLKSLYQQELLKPQYIHQP